MKKAVTFLIIAGFAIVGFFGFCLMMRFSLIGAEEGVKTRWSQVESAYQRRLDLIPNLVETVKGAAKHEKETLTQVTEARNQLLEVQRMASDALKKGDAAEVNRLFEQVAAATKTLVRVSVEAYPTLKANENFLALQSQLEGTENRINVERMKYNDSVGDYNARVRKWGGLPFCSGFETRNRFEAERGAEKAPKVDFSK